MLHVVADKGADSLLEAFIGGEAQLLRPRGVELARPTGDDAVDGGVRLESHPCGDGVTGHRAQRFEHLPHAHADAGQVERAQRAERRSGQRGGVDEVAHHRGRAGEPQRQLGVYRAHRLLAVQRLADDAAGKRRGRLVRLARPHADGGQAQHAAIDEAFARIVVDQQLAHRLLRAVGGLRGDRAAIVDHRRQLAAEHRQRTGEDELHARRPVARRFQQLAGGIEIDLHAEIEIALRMAADDGRQVEQHAAVGVDQPLRRAGLRQIERQTLQARIRQRGGRRGDVRQDQRVEGQRATAVQQRFRQPLAEKTGAAGDDDVHMVLLSLALLLSELDVVQLQTALAQQLLRLRRQRGVADDVAQRLQRADAEHAVFAVLAAVGDQHPAAGDLQQRLLDQHLLLVRRGEAVLQIPRAGADEGHVDIQAAQQHGGAVTDAGVVALIHLAAGVEQAELRAIHQVLDDGKIVGDDRQIETLRQAAGDLEGGGAGVQIDHLAVFHQAGGVFADLALVAMVQLRLLAIGQLLAQRLAQAYAAADADHLALLFQHADIAPHRHVGDAHQLRQRADARQLIFMHIAIDVIAAFRRDHVRSCGPGGGRGAAKLLFFVMKEHLQPSRLTSKRQLSQMPAWGLGRFCYLTL